MSLFSGITSIVNRKKEDSGKRTFCKRDIYLSALFEKIPVECWDKAVIKRLGKNKYCVEFNLGNGKTKRTPIYSFKRLCSLFMASSTITVTLASSVGTLAYNINEDEEKMIDNNNVQVEYIADNNEIENHDVSEDKEIVTEEQNVENNVSIENNQVIENNIQVNSVDSNIIERNIDIVEANGTYYENYESWYNSRKNDCVKYGIKYGIDPAVLLGVICQEAGGIYDETRTENYRSIGVLQLDGAQWEGKIINTFNFNTNNYEKYTIDTDKINNNIEFQIETLAVLFQYYAQGDNYNLTAMIEEHNKGKGVVNKALDDVIYNMPQYNCQSRNDVLNSSNMELMENSVKKGIYWGDRDYFYKVSTYIGWILENKSFDKDYVSIKTPTGLEFVYRVNVRKNDLNKSR